VNQNRKFSAMISQHFDRVPDQVSFGPLGLATGMSLLGLILTLKAAPIMLSLRSPSTDVGLAFEAFYFWGLYLRGFVDVLAFASGV
jgi:hypothetical protein